MTSDLKLWIRFAAIKVSERMAYRWEYLISLVTMFALELVGPFFAYIIYYNSPGFAGWTLHQVIFLQGVLLMVKGIAFSTFFGIVWNSNETLKKGEFDLTLIKPRNPLFMFICQSFDAEDVAKFVGGLGITIYAAFHIPQISALGLLAAAFAAVLGLGFLFSLAVFFSSFIFRFIRSYRVYELLEILHLLGEYPKSIYPQAVQTIFTLLIPVFMIAAVPSEALFGNISWELFASTLTVLGLVWLALKTWFYILKKYASAGG